MNDLTDELEQFPIAGIPVDPDDLSQGMRHPKLGGVECPYLCPQRGRCNRCGWLDPAIYAELEQQQEMAARLADAGFAAGPGTTGGTDA